MFWGPEAVLTATLYSLITVCINALTVESLSWICGSKRNVEVNTVLSYTMQFVKAWISYLSFLLSVLRSDVGSKRLPALCCRREGMIYFWTYSCPGSTALHLIHYLYTVLRQDLPFLSQTSNEAPPQTVKFSLK